jgi:hypothetical protein
MVIKWEKLHDMKVSDEMFDAVIFPELLKLLNLDKNIEQKVYIRNVVLDSKENWTSADGYEINYNLMFIYDKTLDLLKKKDESSSWYSAVRKTKEMIKGSSGFREVSPIVGDITVYYILHKNKPQEKSGVKIVKNIELGFALRKNK